MSRKVLKILLILTSFLVANKGMAHIEYDHLGNVRSVVNESGEVLQYTHYYPNGNIIPALSTSSSFQPYKYNGKELDKMHGLDWYDYGARNYDAVLSRWDRIDPLAEKYYHISPYAYCAGNPVNAIDPDGKSVISKAVKITLRSLYKASKTGIKTLGEAATYADAFNDIVDDVKTLSSEDATAGEKILAGLSLISEVVSPVSVNDVKDVAKGVEKIGNVAEPLVKAENAGRTTRQATKGSKKSFFKNSSYTPKVEKQMSNSNDKQHAFPQSVDGYAEEYGIQSTKIGKDGIKHEWLEVDGSYNGRTGTFEYIKDADGNINHRFFKTK